MAKNLSGAVEPVTDSHKEKVQTVVKVIDNINNVRIKILSRIASGDFDFEKTTEYEHLQDVYSYFRNHAQFSGYMSPYQVPCLRQSLSPTHIITYGLVHPYAWDGNTPSHCINVSHELADIKSIGGLYLGRDFPKGVMNPDVTNGKVLPFSNYEYVSSRYYAKDNHENFCIYCTTQTHLGWFSHTLGRWIHVDKKFEFHFSNNPECHVCIRGGSSCGCEHCSKHIYRDCRDYGMLPCEEENCGEKFGGGDNTWRKTCVSGCQQHYHDDHENGVHGDLSYSNPYDLPTESYHPSALSKAFDLLPYFVYNAFTITAYDTFTLPLNCVSSSIKIGNYFAKITILHIDPTPFGFAVSDHPEGVHIAEYMNYLDIDPNIMCYTPYGLVTPYVLTILGLVERAWWNKYRDHTSPLMLWTNDKLFEHISDKASEFICADPNLIVKTGGTPDNEGKQEVESPSDSKSETETPLAHVVEFKYLPPEERQTAQGVLAIFGPQYPVYFSSRKIKTETWLSGDVSIGEHYDLPGTSGVVLSSDNFMFLDFPNHEVLLGQSLAMVKLGFGDQHVNLIYTFKTSKFIPVQAFGGLLTVSIVNSLVTFTWKRALDHITFTRSKTGVFVTWHITYKSDYDSIELQKDIVKSTVPVAMTNADFYLMLMDSSPGDFFSTYLAKKEHVVPFSFYAIDYPKKLELRREGKRLGNNIVYTYTPMRPTFVQRLSKFAWIWHDIQSVIFITFIVLLIPFQTVKKFFERSFLRFLLYKGYKKVKDTATSKTAQACVFAITLVLILIWLVRRSTTNKTGSTNRFFTWVRNLSALTGLAAATISLLDFFGILETREVTKSDVAYFQSFFSRFAMFFRSVGELSNVKTGGVGVDNIEILADEQDIDQAYQFFGLFKLRIPNIKLEEIKEWTTNHKKTCTLIVGIAIAFGFLIYKWYSSEEKKDPDETYVIASSIVGERPVLTEKHEIKAWFSDTYDKVVEATDAFSFNVKEQFAFLLGRVKTGKDPDGYYKNEGSKTHLVIDRDEHNAHLSDRMSRNRRDKQKFNKMVDEGSNNNAVASNYADWAEWFFHTAPTADKKITYDDLQRYGQVVLVFNTGSGYSAIPLKGNENWNLQQPTSTMKLVKGALDAGLKVYAKVYDPSKHKWLGAGGKKKFQIVKTGFLAEKVTNSVGIIRGITSGAATAVSDEPLGPRLVFCRHHLQADKNSNRYTKPEIDFVEFTFGDIVTKVPTSLIKVDDTLLDTAYLLSKNYPSNFPPTLPVCDDPVRTPATLISIRNKKHYVRSVYAIPPATGKHYDMNISMSISEFDPVIEGDSGSPIINPEGKVIGIQEGLKGTSAMGITLHAKQFKMKAFDPEAEKKNFEQKLNYYRDAKKKIEVSTSKTGAPVFAEYPESLGFSPLKFTTFNYCPVFEEFIGDSPLVVKIAHYPINVYSRPASLHIDSSLQALAKEVGFDPCEKGFAVSNPTLRTAYKDLSKYTIAPTLNPDWSIAHQAVKMVREKFSFLAGFRAVDYMKAMSGQQFSKSSAFPANLKYPTKGAFIAAEQNWLSEFLMRYDSTEESYGEELPQEVLQLCSKVEIRDIDRIKAEKNRTFKNQGVEYSCFERMTFDEALNRVAAHDFKVTGVLAGYSPYYGGFDDFVRWINMDDTGLEFWNRVNAIDMDAKKFDRSLISAIQNFIDDNFWIPLCGDRRTAHLIKKVTRCMGMAYTMMPDGNIVRVMQGAMWSGRQMTLLLNSIYNQIVAHYACLRFGHSPRDILNHIRIATVGDDLKIIQNTDKKMTPKDLVIFYKEFNIDMEGSTELERFVDHPFCGLTPSTTHHLGWIVPLPDVPKISFSMICKKKRMSRGELVEKMIQLVTMLRFSAVFPQAHKFLLKFIQNMLATDENRKVAEAVSKHNIHALEMQYVPLKCGSGLNGSANKIITIMETNTKTHELSRFSSSEDGSFAYRHHGNYCGPGWNDGKFQLSRIHGNGFLDPVDNLDLGCQNHDDKYATPGADLASADFELASVALKESDYAMALAIGSQGILRSLGVLEKYNVTSLSNLSTSIDQEMAKNKNNKKVVKELKKVEKKVESASKQMRKKKRKNRGDKRNRRPRNNRKPNRRVQNTVVGISAPISTGKYRVDVQSTANGSRVSLNMPLTDVISVASLSGLTLQDQFFVTPSLFAGSRVEIEALMFSRYNVKFRLSYHCSTPATTGGRFFWFMNDDPAVEYDIGQRIESGQVPQLLNFMDIPNYAGTMVYHSKWLTKTGLYTNADRPIVLATVPTTDIKFTTAGSILVGAFEAHSAAITVGKIFIEAEFEFYKKSSTLPYQFFIGRMTTTSAFNPCQTIPSSTNYAVGPLSNVNPNEGFEVRSSASFANALDLFLNQPGTYQISWGAATTLSGQCVITGTGCTFVTHVQSANSLVSTIFGILIKTTPIDTGASINLSVSGGSITNGRIFINRISSVPTFVLSDTPPPERQLLSSRRKPMIISSGKEEEKDDHNDHMFTPKSSVRETKYSILESAGLLKKYVKMLISNPTLTVEEFLDSETSSETE